MCQTCPTTHHQSDQGGRPTSARRRYSRHVRRWLESLKGWQVLLAAVIAGAMSLLVLLVTGRATPSRSNNPTVVLTPPPGSQNGQIALGLLSFRESEMGFAVPQRQETSAALTPTPSLRRLHFVGTVEGLPGDWRVFILGQLPGDMTSGSPPITRPGWIVSPPAQMTEDRHDWFIDWEVQVPPMPVAWTVVASPALFGPVTPNSQMCPSCTVPALNDETRSLLETEGPGGLPQTVLRISPSP